MQARLWLRHKQLDSDVNSVARAQALVEYALILVAVAVLVMVVALGTGVAVQRLYGLITGAIGGHYDDHRAHTITIDSAQCISVAAVHQTGIWVTGTTDETLTNVTGSTETISGPVNAYNGGYVFQPLIDASKANTAECPASVVIQAADGTIAVAPLTILNE